MHSVATRYRDLLYNPDGLCVLATDRLTLCGAASAPSIPPHWHGFLMFPHILQICQGPRHFPAIDRLGGLARILEGDTKVRASSAGALGRFDMRSGVADLYSS